MVYLFSIITVFLGQFFVISNCGHKCHLWMELDPSKIWIDEEEAVELEDEWSARESITSPVDRISVC